ncbi:MAG: GTP pyrophosphokinase [Erysipelotrichaceae bacterium]
MRLKIFDQIDRTLTLYQTLQADYHRHEKALSTLFLALFGKEHESIAGINSRVKTESSLREKIIRSHAYQRFETPYEILHSMSDLIGLTLECRFVAEERLIMEHIRSVFTVSEDHMFYAHPEHPNVFLDLAALQPQMQKNGYEIYRLDGYLLDGEEMYRFELQIKALVNLFWSNIEHKLVYKNTNYFVYDGFMKEILGSIKDNLLTIDNQLSIVYRQIQTVNMQDSSLSEENFEKLITKALNDLFALKMSDSIGFNINIKNMSSIVSHYIFMKDLKFEQKSERFTVLFETFRRLNNTDIDFESRICFEDHFTSDDPFANILGSYLYDVVNEDYDWFVFFKMLFFLEPGNNLEDFTLFLSVIKAYLMDHYWFKTSFAMLEQHEAEAIHNVLLQYLATALVQDGTIKIIDSETLNIINKRFQVFVNSLEFHVKSYEDFTRMQADIEEDFMNLMRQVFRRNAYL